MTDYVDADDYNSLDDQMTEEEQEEAASAYEAMMRAEFDSQFARQAWETMQEIQEGDGFLHLT